jgi:hypothetical protein
MMEAATAQLRATGIEATALRAGAELVALYAQVGNDLPTLNGNGQWVLPIPATFVIDRHGVVTDAHVEADYRQRAEPQDVIDRLRPASTSAAGCVHAVSKGQRPWRRIGSPFARAA